MINPPRPLSSRSKSHSIRSSSQADLRRVPDHLDDQPSPSPVSVPPEELQQPEKDLHDALHGPRDDHFAPSVSIDPEEFTFDPEQFPPGELRRLLDDE